MICLIWRIIKSRKLQNCTRTSRVRGGLSFQLYPEYTNSKAELEITSRRNRTLSATVDEILQDLEKEEPELQEL